MRGRGGVDHVAGVVEDWWDTHLVMENVHEVRCSRQVGDLGLKTTQRYIWRVLLSLGLKTRVKAVLKGTGGGT
jgi:hypothetical protein